MKKSGGITTKFILCCAFMLMNSEHIHGFEINGEYINKTENRNKTGIRSHDRTSLDQNGRISIEKELTHTAITEINGEQVSDPCSRGLSCMDSNSSYLPICYCDEECLKYNDCCYDFAYKALAAWPLRNQNGLEKMTCEIGVFGYSDIGIYVNSTCPVTFKYSEISKKCSHKEYPFLVSSEDGTIFRNPYCAYCNNVTNYTVWTFNLIYAGNCSFEMINLFNLSFPAKLKYMKDNNCGIGFIPPKNVRFRTCIKPSHDVMSTYYSRMCSLYQNPIYIGEKDNSMTLYRNIHCYNRTIDDKDSKCTNVYGGIWDEFRGYGNLRMAGLFNIRPAIEIFGKKTCNVNEVYDKKKGVCLPKTCKEEQTHLCGYENVVNYAWKSMPEVFNFNTKGIVDVNFLKRVLSFIYLSLPIDRYNISIQLSIASYKCGMSTNNYTCCSIIIGCKFTNRAETLITDISQFLSKVKNIKWIYSEISATKNMVSASNIQNGDIVEYCDVEKCPLSYRYPKSQFKITLVRFLESKAYKCKYRVPDFINGTVVLSNLSDIEIIQWDTRYTYDNETYHFTTKRNLVTRSNLWSLSTILTYVTLGLSSISLMVTMGVYTYLGLFQSTSGVTTKHLMGSLLAAQVLFIAVVGADIDEMFCLAVGILSHYLWLSAFSWISVFLLCVLKTLKMLFSCPGALTKRQSVPKSVYCLGYGLPSMIVITSVLIDRFSSVDIGYTDGICFPTGVPGNIFIFALPITVFLLINIIVLIISFVLITKFNSTIKQLAPVQKVCSNIPVYIKLSILCAFPWFLGIVSDILDSNVLRHIFTVLSGFHGLLVSLVFLLSNNVTNRIRCVKNRNTVNGNEITFN